MLAAELAAAGEQPRVLLVPDGLPECEFADELSAVTSARRIFEWTPVATNSGGALSCARIGRMQCLCLSSAAERSPRDRFCW
jgi:hypothetical protein